MSDLLKGSTARGFLLVKEEIRERTFKPIGHFTYLVYILIAVVILGGVGIWYELVNLANQEGYPLNSLKMSFLTFSPAIVGSSSFLLIFENQKQKELIAFGLLLLISNVVICLLLAAIDFFDGWIGLSLSVLVSFFSIWVCWMANSNNSGLHDDVDPEDSLGGKPYQEPEGSTEGWSV